MKNMGDMLLCKSAFKEIPECPTTTFGPDKVI